MSAPSGCARAAGRGFFVDARGTLEGDFVVLDGVEGYNVMPEWYLRLGPGLPGGEARLRSNG